MNFLLERIKKASQIKNNNLWITIGFAIWALWLSSVYFIRGPLSWLKIHANADGYVSLAKWFSLHAPQKAATLLDPSMCNVDRIADFGMPTIVEILCVAGIPVQIVFVLLMFFQRFIGGLFTYKLLKEIFRVPQSLAIICGMAFTVGATRGENVGIDWIYLHFLHEPGFPFLLYTVCMMSVQQLKSGSICALGIGLFISMTSQVDIGPIFTLPCALIFGLVARSDLKTWKDICKYLYLCILISLSFIFYQWPHLFAAVLHGPESARSSLLPVESTYSNAANLLKFRLTKMVPHLVLCVFWLIHFNRRSRQEIALLALILITVFGGVFLRPFVSNYSEYLGFFSSFNLDRLFLYGPFFLVVGATIGLSKISFGKLLITLQKGEWQKSIPPITVISVIFAVLIFNRSIGSFSIHWNASLNLNRQGENWHRLYDNPELKSLSREISGQPVRTVTVGAKDDTKVWQPAFNLAYGLETADGFKMIYPGRFHEFWRIVVNKAYVATENNLTRGFMDRFGSRMFLFPPEGENEHLPSDYNKSLLSLANVGYFISDKPIDDPDLELLPQVYTQEMIYQWGNKPLIGKIKGILKDDYLGERLYIYSNKDVFPRAFAVQGVRIFQEDKELLEALYYATKKELWNNVFLSQHDIKDFKINTVNNQKAKVEFLSYSLEKSTILFTGEYETWVVFSNTYSPYWKCRINGVELKIVPAYHSFMAVQVPGGVHEVVFSYEPPYAGWMKTLFAN